MRAKHTTKRIRQLRRRQLALALVAAMAAPMAMAQATSPCAGSTACLPVDGTVASGTITSSNTAGGKVNPYFGQSNVDLTITQTTQGGIIDWGSFSIGTNHTLTFIQPANGVTLNRVVGFGYGSGGCLTFGGCAPTQSGINGSMSATGSVFIVNRAGITFNSTGTNQINVGGLIASTIDISDADFNAGVGSGQYQFSGTSGAGDIDNFGNITTATGGRVAFLGTDLYNSGNITTPQGSVAFGAASSVTLDFTGDGLTQVTVNGLDAPTVIARARNYGTITADGGLILMRALANPSGQGLVENGGTLRAQTLVNRAGRIELTAPGASVVLGNNNDGYLGPGLIDVSGNGAGLVGGSVLLNGGIVRVMSDPVNFSEPSSINANGTAGGGTVDILANFALVYPATTISADATATGDGGSVRILANGVVLGENSTISANGATGNGGTILVAGAGAMAAYGDLSARGGSAGGSITTFSGGDFDIRGINVDAGSIGTPGTWTLWAPNINVVAGSASGTVATAVLGDEVQDADISGALDNGTNVNLRAGTTPNDGGNIYFNAGVDIFYDDGSAPLTFRADAQGSISGNDFSIGANFAPLSMVFNADASNLNNGFAGISFSGATLDSYGGDILFYGQSDVAAGMASSYDTGVELIDSTITSAGGNVLIRGASTGDDAGSDDAGVVLDNTTVDAGAGGVSIHGTGEGVTSGVILAASDIAAGSGGVLVDGRSTNADGIYGFGGDIVTAGGDISLTGVGGRQGIYLDGGLFSYGGNIGLHGEGGSGEGIDASGPFDSGVGDITLYGQSAQSTGIDFGGGASSGMLSAGGDISLTGIGLTGGVALRESNAPILFFGPGDVDEIDSGGGNILVDGTASGAGAIGVLVSGVGLVGSTGDVTVRGIAPAGIGVLFQDGGGITTTSGAISVIGEGAEFGLDVADGAIDTDSGDILLDGTATATTATAGVRVTGGGLTTNGGTVTVTGDSAGGVGVQLGDGGAFAIGSGGGAITITGTGVAAGVLMQANQVDSSGGAIAIEGTGTDAGLVLQDSTIDSANGDVDLIGSALGSGAVAVALDATLVTAGAGDIFVQGIAPGGTGIAFTNGSMVSTTSGAISLIGEGADFGLDIADGAIDTDSGDILLEGTAASTTATAGVRVTGGGLTTNGGNVTVTGSSAGGVGVQFGNASPFAIGSGGGAISITGTGVTAGVLMQANQVDSGGGAVAITGTGDAIGVSLDGGGIDSGGGAIDIEGTAFASGGRGVSLSGTQLIGGAGDVSVRGTAAAGVGVLLAGGAGISTSTGAISLYGTGADFGLDIADGAIDTDSGDILLDGTATSATATAGVRVTGGGLTTNGGDITVLGTSAGGVGVQLGDGGAFAIGSGGGAIGITGSGVTAGVLMQSNQVDSGGGTIDIDGNATGSGATGVDLTNARLSGGAGDVDVDGIAINGTGVRFAGQSGITTSTGDIGVTGIGAQAGLALAGGELTTGSGHLDLRGRGTGASSDGLVLGNGVRIATNGGGIELSGEGGSGAGVMLQSGSSVAAGNSLVVLRAGNDGSSDGLRIGGAISSGMGVNLRPGGVDANGGLTERTGDQILIGGTNGFALSGTELAFVDAPELVIGSNLHAGAIRVLGSTTRNGNLTLQNDGGSGGIDLQAGVNVGSATLALSSGGSITQTGDGAITAHSLLARAGGDVLLAVAGNDVSANTLAGSAGGDFRFQDVDNLAIGNVSARGFDATAGQLSNLGANGISAGGDVFVRNLAGDLTLNAGVTATNIDLVTAGRLQNLAGASLVASGDWRVWANTWEGETRGGLAGSGNLPNLYGCAYLGACGVTVPGVDNHFIYVQQPTALIAFNNFSREYGLPNPLLTFNVTGAILGDTAANVASGSATTTATIGSDVGNYAITGNFLSAAGYRIQFVPGTLAITPATLFFTADGFVRYLGTANPPLSGSVSGFRNGDTVQSVFGSGLIWSTPAGLLSPIGYYPVNGGTTARNYVFSQAPANATALRIIPLPQLPATPIEYIRETVNTYVYDRNIGGAPVCAINASLQDQQLASSGDELSNEWSKVRSRPNLTNCFESERRNSCGDF